MRIGNKNPPAAPTVALFVSRDKKGEIVAATFDASLVGAMTAKFGAVEKHNAKARNTRGMYGKLFGLSKVQKLGADATNSQMTKKERHERALSAVKKRWSMS